MAVYVGENLITEIASGSAVAFRELYELTSDAVYGFALSILKNSHDAEDVMQEVFIKIHSSADTYQRQGKAMAWILTITRNLCYNKIRDHKQHDDIADYAHVATDGSHEQGINAMILKEAMEVLAEDERQIVMLHSMTGMKHREIAEILGMPVSTVLSKYNRSLKKLKKSIEGREV